MSLLRSIGKKQIAVLSQFVGSAACYGTAAGTLVVYMTDWKTVLQYLPYWNGKYPKETEEK